MKRTLSLAAAVALTAGVATTAAATSAQAAPTCSIPASKLTVTAKDLTNPDTAVRAWDSFTVAYTLKDLDGLAAGSCITFSNPTALREIPNGTIDLKAPDGSLIGTQTITNGVVTITLTTDYAAKHTNVKVWGSYTAKIDDSVTAGSTVPLTFTVNGTVTTSQNVTTGTCVGCSAMPVGFAQKYGTETGGHGDVYVNAPVIAKAGTTVVLKDTLTSPGQAFTGPVKAIGYTAKNVWGGFQNVVDLPVKANADGTWSVTTVRDNEALRFTLPMSFTGKGPWTDTATVTAAGQDFSASTSVKSTSVTGSGTGEAPDQPVTPEGKPTPKPTPKMRSYVAQVDTYSWHGSAWYGNKIAAFDNDGILGYREDGFLWMTAKAKKYTSSSFRFVTFTAPVGATKAQLAAAYNKAAPAALRMTTLAPLGTVGARGTVTDVWVLGNGATAAQAWGPKHNINQVFLGRR